MRQQILYIWMITCVSATGMQREQLSTASWQDFFKPRIDFLEVVISGYLKNSTGSESELETETPSLQFLQNKIIDHLYYPSWICSSPYEVACDWYYIESNRPTEKKLVLDSMNHQLLIIKNLTENLLRQPVQQTDTKSLAIEKQLYQECLKLREEKPYIQKSQSLADYAFSNIIQNITNKSWQKIDEELGSMGFGYSFFDIIVTKDYQTKKKMLLLQPPSNVELVDIFRSLPTVMNKLQLDTDHYLEIQLARHFFTALHKANREKSTFDTMTVPEWYDYYFQGNDGRGTQSSEIFWHEIFRSVAKYHEVDTRYIIVQNKEYFQDLERLLRLFSREMGEHGVESFVALKWLIKNLYYVNWKAYIELHPQEKYSRNSYCVEQIELYGASQIVLQSLENNTDIKYLLEPAKTVLHYIVQTIDIDIFISQNLRETEKSMLKTFLFDITAPILKNQTNSLVVDNFYGDFKVTHNYFNDIIEYRKIVNTAENKFIDKYGSAEKLPFNINDLSKPQNRLLLRAYLRMHLLASPYLNKEYYYGVYGTEMSRFIYDLVISKRFGLKEKRENDEDWLYTKIQYPNEYKTCLSGKVPDNEIDTVISEVIALKTAYESMTQNYLRDIVIKKPFVFDDGVKYSADAIFLLSYFQNHCFWSKSLGSHVLRNFKPSSSAFGCDFESPRCNIEAF